MFCRGHARKAHVSKRRRWSKVRHATTGWKVQYIHIYIYIYVLWGWIYMFCGDGSPSRAFEPKSSGMTELAIFAFYAPNLGVRLKLRCFEFGIAY